MAVQRMKEFADFKTYFNSVTGKYRTNHDHLLGTAELSKKRSKLPELDNIAYLAALLHDVGKYSEQRKKYFLNSVKGGRSGEKPDHATAGGQAAKELLGNSAASVMIHTAIYSHHGLCDCHSSDDTFLLESRRNKAEGLPVAECEGNFYKRI